MSTAEERRKRRERSEKAFAARLKANFGITPETYWELYRYQGGRCYHCRIATGATRRLAVDHDHNKGCGHDPKKGCPECNRGLLCHDCNQFLGYRAHDRTDAYERAIEYLKDPPFQRMRREEGLWRIWLTCRSKSNRPCSAVAIAALRYRSGVRGQPATGV